MNLHRRALPFRPLLLACAVMCNAGICATDHVRESQPATFRGILLEPSALNPSLLAGLKRQFNAIVLAVDDRTERAIPSAAQSVRAAGIDLWYWIEVARHEPIAAEHPEWLASLQGHSEWRRFHPDVPAAHSESIIRNFPWVPILSREGFEAQRQRLRGLLAPLPVPTGVFLNDLQGAPSACGCGHPLCRWTSGYGPKSTSTPLGPSAAAQFTAAIRTLVAPAEVVPVWTPECEADDQDTLCGGVGCWHGRCWPEWTQQLQPVAARNHRIGVLALVKTFNRDQPRDRPQAAWITRAVQAFQHLPPLHGGTAVPPRRLITVLEGWDTTEAEQKARIAQSLGAGAGGFLLAARAIDQSWQPRLAPYPPGKRSPTGRRP